MGFECGVKKEDFELLPIFIQTIVKFHTQFLFLSNYKIKICQTQL